jgi:uncharacterized protein YlxP (DUF503 family)
MIVGVARLSLSIPGARSLKEKRHALRRVIDRLKAHHNVAVAEVADNDLWQRAKIGVVTVSNDHAFVGQVLDKVIRDVGTSDVVELLGREVEIDSYADLYGDLADKPFVDGPRLQTSQDWDVEAEERALRDAERSEPPPESAGAGQPQSAVHPPAQPERRPAPPEPGADEAPGWLREEDLR